MDIKDVKRMEIHSHSMYSNIRLLDSINRPKDLLRTAAELGYSGLTITDHEALCGHVDFLDGVKELKEANIIPQDFKLGLGNEIYLIDDGIESGPYYHFILIAKDTIGHKALRELSSNAWRWSYVQKGMERVPTHKGDLERIVKKYPGHLIATTACLGGELARLTMNLVKVERGGREIPTELMQYPFETDNTDPIYILKKAIYDFLTWCKDLFGDDLYIEVAPSKSDDQIVYNRRVKDIAAGMGIKMIFATDAHYLTKKDRPVHKAYLNSKNGDREVDDFYAYAHLQDNWEAYNNLYPVFDKDEFITMCNNTMEIRGKIGEYEIFHNPIIPQVEVAEYDAAAQWIGLYSNLMSQMSERWPTLEKLLYSDNSQEKYWVNQCIQGLVNKGLLTNEKYLDRLEIEADVIHTIGDKLGNCLFAYFNTFQHYIDLFWECGSLSGPGRGSSVCFLSDYLLGITQLDPLAWDLPYWRFLNKERVELPDIDTDLSPSKRKLIFHRIRQERGETNVVQVATFGTEKAKSAILTACRGYRSDEFPNGIDVDIAHYLSSLVPSERGFTWTLNEVVYGDEEKDRKPIQAFINEVGKYPGLLDIMISIEGLVKNRGQHASGVILYNNSPTDTNALMKSPNGDLTTQFDLHCSERLGDVKFDFLVTEVCDKLTNAIELLKKDGYFQDCSTLREIYEKNLHPAVLDLSDKRIWDSLAAGDTMDVFQFNSEVGLQAAKTIKPKNPLEMTLANAMMRLMGEKGKERPLDRFARMNNNIDLWYEECRLRGLSEDQIKILEKYYLSRGGTPAMQEDLMMVCMDENIAHFTLKEANQARKIVAKKKMDQVEGLKEKFISQCEDRNFGNYVWETTMGPQMGYSFALPHALAYSFVGIQTLVLANFYPSIYWNCACLITNSGGNDDAEEDEQEEIVGIYEKEDDDDAEYEDLPDRSGKKKKTRNTNYGKISTAIGQMAAAGIQVSPPDINKSSYTFVPDVENNKIIYGIKGITRIGSDIIYQIMIHRPYESLDDFLSKVKVNKVQMVNLIKSGAFDCFGERTQIMHDYILSISDQKQRLTLQNMAMLIEKGLIPESHQWYARVFNFNKYLKKHKYEKFNAYGLDDAGAVDFFCQYFDEDDSWYEEVDGAQVKVISQTKWDALYKKTMNPMRDYLKANKEEVLAALNSKLFQETYDKYCEGSLSKWEMDSIGFYYHEHELAHINEEEYGIVDYNRLPIEPPVERFIPINAKNVPIYRLSRVAGTVINKDKAKNTISLLTNYGVVNVKIYKTQFAHYDKQISAVGDDGKKHIVEKSWLSRGNKLLLTGIRRDDTFQLKKYKSTPGSVLSLITSVNSDGTLNLKEEREGEE